MRLGNRNGHAIDEGYRYGRLAVEIYEMFQEKSFLCGLSLGFYGYIACWRDPFESTLAPLKEAHNIGLQTGDLEAAAVSPFIGCYRCGKKSAQLTRLSLLFS